MISLSRFLQCIQENVDRITHYELGGDGSGGGCDCIGLIIGALALAGFRWPGVHGSNWAARNAMAEELSPIAGAGDLFPGEIVFKAKAPGESGYDLPAAYKDSGDLLDYYHVGVVTSISPLCITHCTGVEGGVKVDSALGKWAWGGRLKYVEAAPEEPVEQAVVTAENGYPVRMREAPTTKSAVVASVSLGAVVDVLGQYDDQWTHIQWNGQRGYMMRRFLMPVSQTDGEVAVSRVLLLKLRNGLEEALQAVDAALNETNK